VDCDHGNATEADARDWMQRAGLPQTYTVHTGRRTNPKDGTPEYGVQLYYSGNMPAVGEFSIACGTGQVKTGNGYVMAAGSIHPLSHERYEVWIDAPIVPLPDVVRALKTEHKSVEDDGQPIRENRNIRLTSIAGKLRNAGLSPAALEVALLQVNADRCEPTLEEEEVKQIAASVGRYALPEPEIDVTIGGRKEKDKPSDYPRTLRETLEADAEDVGTRRESMIVNWRGLFHTKDDVLNCPKPTYFIQDFLQHEAICGIAAPVGQRKSLIALNVARSLCTGEPLFGFLPVVNKPSRVLYLCPEMGLISMSERTRNAGLTDCLGNTLLLRSMNFGGLNLLDLNKEALKDSVLILDTAIRFVEGDENSAKDMRIFSDMLFGLQRLQGPHGAIIILYHSPKTTKDAFELTLENCLRGSGELGASLTDCWGTRMQNPEKGWDSLNFISHVKVRDYAGPKDFEVFCDKPTGIMSRVGDPDVAAVLVSKKGGQKANPEEAERGRAYINENPNMTVKQLMAGGQAVGINHKRNWWTDRRMEVRGGGSVLRSE
jgi:hypothetical protein